MRHWLPLLALLVACGGRIEDEDAPGEPAPGSGATGSGATSDAGDGFDLGSSPLPPCDPGFEANDERRCDWMFDGLCYDDKTAACACACPPGRSTCSSDFPEPNGRVEVRCF